MEFVTARNPDRDSSLPYLVRLPIGAQGTALKVRDTWPRTAKVYCHRADAANVWEAYRARGDDQQRKAGP